MPRGASLQPSAAITKHAEHSGRRLSHLLSLAVGYRTPHVRRLAHQLRQLGDVHCDSFAPHLFVSNLAAYLTFQIDRVRSFHPVPCNRAGIHSRCSSHHRPDLCRVRSFRPEPSTPRDIHSMSDDGGRSRSRAVDNIERWQVRAFQPRQLSKPPK
jgi:hypothetical protein